MAVKNLQSVVCNVATQRGNVTNLDSKGYGMAMYQPPAMSSPQYPVLGELAQPGQRRERERHCSTIQAATRTGVLASWQGISGSRGACRTGRSEATGNRFENFPRRIRNLARLAAISAVTDDQDKTIRFESLAGSTKA
jgi:hypothetical protein